MEQSNSLYDPSLERRLTGHRGEVTGLSFNHDSTQLVSSSADTTVILWNLKKHARAIKFEKHSDHVTDVQFLPNGKLFASCSKDKGIRLWKPSIKSVSKEIIAHTAAVRSVHASSDSTFLLSASNDKNIKMWMCEYNNKFVSTFHGHTHWVNCARFSCDGKYVISCSEDKTMKLWDRHSNCCIHTFEEAVAPKYVEFHPNDKCMGVCFANNHTKIYDIRSQKSYKLLQFYAVHTKSVNKLSFHPNGNFLMTASGDGLVKVYDLIEGRMIYTLEGHDGPVTAVAFSPDTRYFATAGADKTVLVWNTNFDKEILAKSLEKCSASVKPKEENREGKVRRVDARLSFGEMEQPEVDVSSLQVSPIEENAKRDTVDDEFNSQNAEDSVLSGAGDATCKKGPDVLEQVKNKVEVLKSEVKRLQSQLTEVLVTLESVEKRTDLLENS